LSDKTKTFKEEEKGGEKNKLIIYHKPSNKDLVLAFLVLENLKIIQKNNSN
jgi:hypothetical protein